MARLNFPPLAPDCSDLNAGYTRIVRNVVPRSDGYGPFHDLQSFTQSLPGPCRGYVFARLPDSTVMLLAGTETRLYQLDNTTLRWTDVSKGGNAYADLDTDANWSFAQFGNIVTACQRNTVPQSIDITATSPFANLGGSPPAAGHVTVLGPFLVLSDLTDDPNAIQWSGVNAITTWNGTNSSDFSPLADGGRARCVVSLDGDVGLIFQDAAVRRIVWAPGDERVFQIDRLETADGILAPSSAIAAPGGAYFLSPRGFVRLDASGSLTPIGEERINRTFLGQHDASAPQAVRELAYDEGAPRLVIAASDPKRGLILWSYKTAGGAENVFDRILVYHTTLQRWSIVEMVGEYLAPVSQPGLTLEALDAIAPGAIPILNVTNNGSGLIRVTVGSTADLTTGDFRTISGVEGVTAANGNWTLTVIDATRFDLNGSVFAGTYTVGGVVAGSLDDLPFSLDDASIATLPNISAFGPEHTLGFFTGPNLEAELDSAEQSLGMRRMNINAMWPVTDASAAYCRTLVRDRQVGEWTELDESQMNEDGRCPLLDEGRYARARLRIPAGTEWTFATGIDPEVLPAGAF